MLISSAYTAQIQIKFIIYLMRTRAQRREEAIKNEGSTKKKKKDVIKEKI